VARIFISYRRDDSAGHAGRLYDRLSEKLGADVVFMDVDGIEPGADFVETIEQQLSDSIILLAVIGRYWLSVIDAANRRRIDNPNDFVRVEIATALKRGIRVVPVLVHGAAMPAADQLPDSLAPLARRNAIELKDGSWRSDVERLVAGLANMISNASPAAASAAQSSSQPSAAQPADPPALDSAQLSTPATPSPQPATTSQLERPFIRISQSSGQNISSADAAEHDPWSRSLAETIEYDTIVGDSQVEQVRLNRSQSSSNSLTPPKTAALSALIAALIFTFLGVTLFQDPVPAICVLAAGGITGGIAARLRDKSLFEYAAIGTGSGFVGTVVSIAILAGLSETLLSSSAGWGWLWLAATISAGFVSLYLTLIRQD
jgi:hypothetical protein